MYSQLRVCVCVSRDFGKGARVCYVSIMCTDCSNESFFMVDEPSGAPYITPPRILSLSLAALPGEPPQQTPHSTRCSAYKATSIFPYHLSHSANTTRAPFFPEKARKLYRGIAPHANRVYMWDLKDVKRIRVWVIFENNILTAYQLKKIF